MSIPLVNIPKEKKINKSDKQQLFYTKEYN